MLLDGERRIEPAPELLEAARRWLEGPRAALGSEFLAAYLTGSVLTVGFDPKQSEINLLVVARSLDPAMLDALAASIPAQKKGVIRIQPLFLTRRQIEKSLDTFPIEWLEIQERHLRLEGEDVFGPLEVPQTYLRLQCEHELRGKHIRLRQAYLANPSGGGELGQVLRGGASGFATLFRTLLRLRGETPPAETGRVMERLAQLYHLDAQGLLGAHLFRYSPRDYKAAEVKDIYMRFLAEVDRLINAIDELKT